VKGRERNRESKLAAGRLVVTCLRQKWTPLEKLAEKVPQTLSFHIYNKQFHSDCTFLQASTIHVIARIKQDWALEAFMFSRYTAESLPPSKVELVSLLRRCNNTDNCLIIGPK
jgi:hypothetical protein